MGMFDYVQYEAPCKKCGYILTEWQSKDGDCTLDTIQPEEVENLYTSCPECKTWNELIWQPGKFVDLEDSW